MVQIVIYNTVRVSTTTGNLISGTYSRPIGCIKDPYTCRTFCGDEYPKIIGTYPTDDICRTNFHIQISEGWNINLRSCIKDNCLPPTEPSPTTTEPSSNPTTFTVDTMATTATSSASKDVGLIGRAVSYVKDSLSWINRLGTGGRPSQDVVTKDFTYSMQSKVRSRISRDVWIRCVDDANENYNRGLGYITPVEIFNRKPPQFWRS